MKKLISVLAVAAFVVSVALPVMAQKSGTEPAVKTAPAAAPAKKEEKKDEAKKSKGHKKGKKGAK